MEPIRKFCLWVGLAMIVCCSVAWAGNGTINQTTGRVNLTVSVQYNATAQGLEGWHQRFQAGSQSLFDATDGQVRYGTIRVYCNSANSENADVFFFEGTGTANSTLYVPGTQGIGASGRINHFEDDSGPVFAHEFAHYGFGVGDEYEYDSPNYGDAMCQGPTAQHESKMERSERTDFCVAHNHVYSANGYLNPHKPVYQQVIHPTESCWETIHNHYTWINMPPVTELNPDGLPNHSSSGNPGDIEWVLLGCQTRVVLCLDRSGSMDGTPIAAARNAARLLALLSESGSYLAVVSFSTSAQVNYPMQQLGGLFERGPILSAIGTISAGGNTSFGAGMSASLSQITGQGEPSSTETIIFMSDGQHNTPPDVDLAALQARHVRVFTLGFGSNPDDARLQAIANATGGSFYRVPFSGLRDVPYPDDITSTMANILSDATEIGTVDRSSELLSIGEVEQWPARVEQGAEWVDFVVNWTASAGRINFTLTTPGGNSINPGNFSDYVEDLSSGFAFYRIPSPEAGEWIMNFAGDQLNQATSYRRQVRIRNPKIGFTVKTYPDAVAPHDSVLIQAMLRYELPITGAAVTAEVVDPAGLIRTITLFDDGSPHHGDLMAGDGTFSAIYRPIATGTFSAYLHAENFGSANYVMMFREPPQPGDTAIPPRPSVPLFRRFATVSFLGEGSGLPMCECHVETLSDGPHTWSYRLTNDAASTCDLFDLTVDTECDNIDSCSAPAGWTCMVSGRRVTYTATLGGLSPGMSLEGFGIHSHRCLPGMGMYLVGADVCSDSIPVPCCTIPPDLCNADSSVHYTANILLAPAVTAHLADSNIVLRWTRVPAADFYRVYSSASVNGEYTSVGFSLDTMWTDTTVASSADKFRFYYVMAFKTASFQTMTTDSVTGYWPMEEGTGTTTACVDHPNYDGTLHGAEWIHYPSGGDSCWAIHFAYGKWVTVPNDNVFYDAPLQIDVHMRVNQIMPNNLEMIVNNTRYAPTNGGFMFYVDRYGKLEAVTWDGLSWRNIVSPVSVPVGEWFDASLVINGDQSFILLNGTVVAAGNLPFAASNNSMPFTFGAQSLPNGGHEQFLFGDIAWARITRP